MTRRAWWSLLGLVVLLSPADALAQADGTELASPLASPQASTDPSPTDLWGALDEEDVGLVNPRVHGGFDDGWLYTGMGLTIATYLLGTLHAISAFRPCPAMYRCNDWAAGFAFVPVANWAVGFRGGTDIGGVTFITGGVTAGLQLFSIVVMLVGALHHHPNLLPDGLGFTFD